jgi:hypothetical protein
VTGGHAEEPEVVYLELTAGRRQQITQFLRISKQTGSVDWILELDL